MQGLYHTLTFQLDIHLITCTNRPQLISQLFTRAVSAHLRFPDISGMSSPIYYHTNSISFIHTFCLLGLKMRLNKPSELGSYRLYSSAKFNKRVLPLSPRSCHEPGSNSQPVCHEPTTVPEPPSSFTFLDA